MGREIERKFLLANGDWRRAVGRSEAMSQGYLANDGTVSVRVRATGAKAWLNIKAGGLVAARDEFEYEIPFEEGRELLTRLCKRPLIEKTRHWVSYRGFEWEIDEFRGQNEGLIVAELELEREDQTFPRPSWLGMEVTDAPRYYNVKLVEYPYCEWNDAERSP